MLFYDCPKRKVPTKRYSIMSRNATVMRKALLMFGKHLGRRPDWTQMSAFITHFVWYITPICRMPLILLIQYFGTPFAISGTRGFIYL